jgi:hypothetical protein
MTIRLQPTANDLPCVEEFVMRSTKLSIRCAAAAISLVSVSAAQAGEKEMVGACIQHYIADQLAAYDGKIRVDAQDATYQPLLTASTYSDVAIELTDRASGKTLANALCKVDRMGKVLSVTPTSAMSQKLAARLKPTTVARTEADAG